MNSVSVFNRKHDVSKPVLIRIYCIMMKNKLSAKLSAKKLITDALTTHLKKTQIRFSPSCNGSCTYSGAEVTTEFLFKAATGLVGKSPTLML